MIALPLHSTNNISLYITIRHEKANEKFCHMQNILFHIKYILVKWMTIIGKILMDQWTKKDGEEIHTLRQSFEDYIGFAIK